MKQSVYIRIAKNGKVNATNKPSQEPLKDSYGKSIPTVFLALQLEIPDAAFKPPNIQASIKVPIEHLGVAIETVDPLKLLV